MMDELVKLIEKTVSELLRYDKDKYNSDAQELVNALMMMIPAVINCYNDPRMSDMREDALYWPGQTERIIEALKGGDRFEAADVLYNEMRPNLMELMSVMKQRGLM